MKKEIKKVLEWIKELKAAGATSVDLKLGPSGDVAEVSVYLSELHSFSEEGGGCKCEGKTEVAEEPKVNIENWSS